MTPSPPSEAAEPETKVEGFGLTPLSSLKEYTDAAIAMAKQAESLTVCQVGNLLFAYDHVTERILIVSAKERTIVTFYKADDGFKSFLDAIRKHEQVLDNL